VSLLNIDHEEFRPVLVLPIKLVEGGNLPPEGRSGVTAEDEHDRLGAAEGRKLNARLLVLGLK
jgi:hypothetical protein